jgi:uncharacterized membrane-anchored protein YjiN (DUF445 family)
LTIQLLKLKSFGLLQKYPKNVTLEKDESIISDSDSIKINLIFDDGIKCKINIDRTSPQKRKEVKLRTKSGEIYYWIDKKVMRLNKDHKNFEVIYETVEEPLKNEIKEFLGHIETNQEPIMNKSIAHNVVKISNQLKDQQTQEKKADTITKINFSNKVTNSYK